MKQKIEINLEDGEFFLTYEVIYCGNRCNLSALTPGLFLYDDSVNKNSCPLCGGELTRTWMPPTDAKIID